ncbi:MAG: anti-sigma factor [Myxococcota bacterium]
MRARFLGMLPIAAALMGLGIVGCSDDDPTGSPDASTSPDASVGGATSTLTYSVTNLEPLGDDFVYEGWIVVDGSPVTTGTFTVDAAGVTTPASFEVPQAMLDMATLFVISIEPAVGDVPAPADTKILGGPIENGTATLTTSAMPALGTDFADAAGNFIIATPSSAAMDDEEYGIWFLDPSGPSASLTLPTLPAGWVYEGWVVDADGPISTGTFTAVDAADSDMAGPLAGTDGMMPPFPGQDFVTTPRDLTMGHMAVISVEPSPDNSAAPFILKPLGGPIGTDLAPATQSLNNIAAMSLPSGTVTFTAN